MAPPRSPEGTAVVLIIDKSSSMEGRKIELARLAAIGVVENLRPIDTVGVLIFDNSFQWAVPVRRAGMASGTADLQRDLDTAERRADAETRRADGESRRADDLQRRLMEAQRELEQLRASGQPRRRNNGSKSET